MVPLNLPSFDHKVEFRAGLPYILDVFRSCFVRLTPEEWVRQHMAHYLLRQGCPKGRIKLEHPFCYGRQQKRADMLVFNAAGVPWLLGECKAPGVQLTQATWEQVTCYNQTLQAPLVMVTNGQQHLCCSIDREKGNFQHLAAIPGYEKFK